MSPWRLVADVGGTNVRFARATLDGALADVASTPTLAHQSFSDAMANYLSGLGGSGSCVFAAIGAAGPVDHGVVQLTNGAWRIDAGAISADLGGKPVRLINDLEAVAHAAPRLKAEDLAPIIGPAEANVGPRLVINVGTGFGAAIAAPAAEGWIVIGCEPGHMRLALDARIAARLKVENPSIENVMSGLALQSAWRADSVLASDEFARLLGQVCGDLVLATGAWGGVYTCGSVASAWVAQSRFDAFREAFEDKGPMSARMRGVPIAHIVNPHAALLGLAALPEI